VRRKGKPPLASGLITWLSCRCAQSAQKFTSSGNRSSSFVTRSRGTNAFAGGWQYSAQLFGGERASSKFYFDCRWKCECVLKRSERWDKAAIVVWSCV
jgi:hypothetical protein